MRTKNTPSRETQREIILRSAEYLSGDSFTRIDAARLLGLSNESGAHLLSSMAQEGLLKKRLVRAQGSKASGTIRYGRPPSKLLRVKWRRLSDHDIGLTA